MRASSMVTALPRRGPERGHAVGRIGTAAGIALLLLAAGPATGAGGLEVSVDGGRMSADVGAVPLADVLTAVAEQTGARLSVRGELGKVRPQAFDRVPLAEALPRLAQPNGLILRFDDGAEGNRRLLAIHAVAPGSGASPSAAPRTVVSSFAPTGLWTYDDPETLPESGQRIDTVGRVAKRRTPSPLPALKYILAGDPDPMVRRAALGYIAALPGEEARRAVLQTVADPDPEMRMSAMRALAAGRDKPVSLLAQVVKGDTDPNVRLAAIELLSRSDGDLARVVLEGARSDREQQVREAAERSLRR
jgi:phosphoribosylcarboxyaminoimidazole (NCAIR) mutase